MDYKTDDNAWKNINIKDLWIFDKLILSKKLGYTCGPSGVSVPYSGKYCIRPITNLHGMGINARFEYLENSTDHLHPSEFWCEVFSGTHLSIDYYKKQPILSVEGIREKHSPLYQWSVWRKSDKIQQYPSILSELVGEYDYINCEFIGNNLIEVHFRQNPDFIYNNTEAIPVWKGEKIQKPEGYTWISSKDYKRLGFYIK